MNSTSQNSIPAGGDQGAYEATLHAIAHAPVPEGIEARVNAALKAAPRHARVFDWPSSRWVEGGRAAGAMTGAMTGWTRAAAAAAIVAIVSGGGWGVYSHVQHQSGKAMVTPAVSAGPASGFSSAGAMRTPQTVQGPVLVQPDKAKTSPKRAKKRVKPASKPASPSTAQRVASGK